MVLCLVICLKQVFLKHGFFDQTSFQNFFLEVLLCCYVYTLLDFVDSHRHKSKRKQLQCLLDSSSTDSYFFRQYNSRTMTESQNFTLVFYAS